MTVASRGVTLRDFVIFQLKLALDGLTGGNVSVANAYLADITPEDERSTHYFYALARNHDRDNTEADAKIREWQRVAFKEQDQPMLEAVQDRMGTSDLMSLKPVILTPDNLAMRARRIITRLREQDDRRQDRRGRRGTNPGVRATYSSYPSRLRSSRRRWSSSANMAS